MLFIIFNEQTCFEIDDYADMIFYFEIGNRFFSFKTTYVFNIAAEYTANVYNNLCFP